MLGINAWHDDAYPMQAYTTNSSDIMNSDDQWRNWLTMYNEIVWPDEFELGYMTNQCDHWRFRVHQIWSCWARRNWVRKNRPFFTFFSRFSPQITFCILNHVFPGPRYMELKWFQKRPLGAKFWSQVWVPVWVFFWGGPPQKKNLGPYL